jgi:hypothetical protein
MSVELFTIKQATVTCGTGLVGIVLIPYWNKEQFDTVEEIHFNKKYFLNAFFFAKDQIIVQKLEEGLYKLHYVL